jgi:hypothetical protein
VPDGNLAVIRTIQAHGQNPQTNSLFQGATRTLIPLN